MNTKQAFKQKNWYLWEIGIVVLLALAAVVINWILIRDGVSATVDIQVHITWLQHFYKQILEGIWYPRWLAGTNYGYGSPTFVFYPPLVYYIGSFLKIIGFNIEQSIIGLFLLSSFGAGLAFYIYGRNRWGRIAAFAGALAYMTAPYIAINIYRRGALPETFAMVWIPLIMWVIDRAILQLKWKIVLAILCALLSLTHVPSLLTGTIFLVGYTLFFLQNQSWKNVLKTIIAISLGFGLVSAYLLPAIIEKSLVNIETMRQVSGGFSGNFIKIVGSMSGSLAKDIQFIFRLSWLGIIVLELIHFFSNNKRLKINKQHLLWLLFLGLCSFLMTPISNIIWQSSKILQMIQFPWRIMGLFSFGLAALYAITVNKIILSNRRSRNSILLIILSVFLYQTNIYYQQTENVATVRNPQKGWGKYLPYVEQTLADPYTNKLWDVPEYRPLLNDGSAPPPPIIGEDRISVVDGEAEFKINKWGSYNRIIDLTINERSTIRIRTYYYPGWHLYVNDLAYPIDVFQDGTITFTLEPGTYIVELRYQWTLVFKVGIGLSIVSFLILSAFGLGFISEQ